MPAGLPRTPWTSAAATLIRPWIRLRSARSAVPIQAGSISSCASKKSPAPYASRPATIAATRSPSGSGR